MPPRSLTAPDGSIRTIQLKAEVSVDPGVLVGDYGLNRQGGRGDADGHRLLDRGADRHEFDQTMADLGTWRRTAMPTSAGRTSARRTSTGQSLAGRFSRALASTAYLELTRFD